MADNRKAPAPEGSRIEAGKTWWRIPNGTKVRHRLDGQEGTIDGLTEFRKGSGVNPDGKTQYRVNVGAPERRLAAEEDLLIVADAEGLVQMGRENAAYRRIVTERLRSSIPQEQFVT